MLTLNCVTLYIKTDMSTSTNSNKYSLIVYQFHKRCSMYKSFYINFDKLVNAGN